METLFEIVSAADIESIVCAFEDVGEKHIIQSPLSDTHQSPVLRTGGRA
jgi:hypothetical protein